MADTCFPPCLLGVLLRWAVRIEARSPCIPWLDPVPMTVGNVVSYLGPDHHPAEGPAELVGTLTQ